MLDLNDLQATSDEGTAYLGTQSELTALSLADATEQWTLSPDTALDGVARDDDGLFTLQDRTVQAIDPETGDVRWTREGVDSTPFPTVVVLSASGRPGSSRRSTDSPTDG